MIKPVVLVVEDEPLIRLFASDMIEEAGFEVLQASNATAAIATMEDRRDIRVVFTDVDMPGGISGIKLAECIRARWPDVQIIVTSGRPWPAEEPIPTNVVFFPKPYRQDRVLDTVKRMAA
ncbi:response regulator [Novosphingobium sp.]|uniref:response regulator n=1 Tax=Novosphingobium sp. TaxID=1874826 RepID=UPI001DE88030|nr:response regulator [Novosphingobium sp.]MBX9664590.1 response regulator [Novosphingobium sp.]